jgi:hypothetical protein
VRVEDESSYAPVGLVRCRYVAGRPRTRAKLKQQRRVVKRLATEDVHTALLRATEEGNLSLAIAPATPTGDVLVWALRRIHATMLWAASEGAKVQADEFWVSYYDNQGNVRVEPNRWFQLERAMREEAVKLANRMVELGLAERAVVVEEAKAVLVAQAVRTAAEAAGIPNDQIVRLGEELRKGLEEGTVQDAEVVAA